MDRTEITTHSDRIEVLNSFLRVEISAVETYRQAIPKIKDRDTRQRLEGCQHSHERRAQQLRTQVWALGGTSVESSGVWGAFMKLLQGGAQRLGRAALIAVLEEGEDHVRETYRSSCEKLDIDMRDLVELQLLPEQNQTHGVVSAIKHGRH